MVELTLKGCIDVMTAVQVKKLIAASSLYFATFKFCSFMNFAQNLGLPWHQRTCCCFCMDSCDWSSGFSWQMLLLPFSFKCFFLKKENGRRNLYLAKANLPGGNVDWAHGLPREMRRTPGLRVISYAASLMLVACGWNLLCFCHIHSHIGLSIVCNISDCKSHLFTSVMPFFLGS